MKRFFCFMTLASSMAALFASQPSSQLDTTRIYELDVVEIVTTQARQTTPVAHENINVETMLRNSYGNDLPSTLAFRNWSTVSL